MERKELKVGKIIRAIGDNYDCWETGDQFELFKDQRGFYIHCHGFTQTHYLNEDDPEFSFLPDFELVKS